MTENNPSWLAANADRLANGMFIASAVLTSADGTVALVRGDYLTGVLGIAAALASAAGAIVTSKAAKVQGGKRAV